MPTYYMRADGTASSGSPPTAPGPGTEIGNCLSIANHNASTFSAGDTIVLSDAGGVYRDQMDIPSSGSSGAGNVITYQAEGTPIISGADEESTWVSESGNIYTKDVGYDSGVVLENGVPLTFVAWDTDKATTLAAMSQGSYANDVPNAGTNVYIWSTDDADPDTHTIEVSARDYCIYSIGKDYITIDGFTIEGSIRQGIYLHYNNDYWTIQNNIIKNIGGKWEGSVYLGNGVELGSNTTNHLVDSNLIYNIFDSGISPQSSSNTETIATITISNNTIYKCGLAGVEISAWSNDTSISDITVSNNDIYDNGEGWSGDRGGYGVWVVIGSANTGSTITSTIITENKIHSNAGEDIRIGEINGDVTISKNSLYDSVRGVMVEDGDNPTATEIIMSLNLVYGHSTEGLFYNVLNDTNGGITLYSNTFYGNGGWNVRIYQHGSGTELIKNNIFFGTTNYAFADDAGIDAGAGQDYNLYYRASGDVINYGGTGYDLTEWEAYKTASSQDSNSPTMADPLFTNAGADVFTLQSTSPAKDGGIAIGGYNDRLAPTASWPDSVGTMEDEDAIGAYGYTAKKISLWRNIDFYEILKKE